LSTDLGTILYKGIVLGEIRAIVDRMKQVINASSYEELARFLGISKASISKWIERNKIPEKNIYKFINSTNVNKDWLLTGKGEPLPDSANINIVEEQKAVILSDVKSVIDRMKQVLKVNTNSELAAKLRTTLSNVDNWKKRKSIPDKYILLTSQMTGANQSWLLTGQGSMFSDNSSHNTPPKLDKEFEVICEYLKDLDRSKRKKVLKYILELSDNGDK